MKRRIIGMLMTAVIALTTVDVSAFATEKTVSSSTMGDVVEGNQTLSEEVKYNGELSVQEEADELESVEKTYIMETEEANETFLPEKIQESAVEEETADVDYVESTEATVTASGQCGDNLTWTLENGTLTISGTGDMWNYVHDVESQPWYSSGENLPQIIMNENVTKLVIEEGITSIGDGAFRGCGSLSGELVIPKGLTSIGELAFEGCIGLVGDLIIPTGVTSIGVGAFGDCVGFNGRLVIPNEVTDIGEGAFSDCHGFTGELVIPEGLINIKNGAFDGLSSMSGELIIPDGVTNIGSWAFYECSGFSGDLIIPEGVTNVGIEAFERCSGFDNIVFSGDAPNISSMAFRQVVVNVYYPAWKSDWENVVGNNYGGTLNWIAYGDGETPWKPVEIPSEVIQYNGHYYKRYDMDLTWDKAKEYCEEQGGHLVTITSTEEDAFVCSISKAVTGLDYWLGASDEIEEGNWKWVTGEPWGYTNWSDEQPDNNQAAGGKAGEDYLQIWKKGTWNDSIINNTDEPGNDEVGGFVCEWDTILALPKEELDLEKAIIEEVKKYTSDEVYFQYKAIMNSNLANEEKMKRLSALFYNNGITDVQEGTHYVSEVSSHRRDYLYLVTNENYCAFDWWYWLNTTINGLIARGVLYADGLIFNFELASYINWETYATEKYPGVEKCKGMLKMFMMDEEDPEYLAMEVANNSKNIIKDMKRAITLNNLVADAEMNEIMDKIINAKTNEQLEKYQGQFADWMKRQVRIQQNIEIDGEVKLYLGTDAISKVLDYAAPIIEVAEATVEDVVGIMKLENEIKKYQEYENFLKAVYSSMDISKEMRIAAYQLLEEIENGYMNKVKSILTNFFIFEMSAVKKIYFDKGLLKTYLESKGLSTVGVNLLGQAMGTLNLATVISNIIIDMGDFVKQAAYTMSYAELATFYSFKLQEDKEEFKKKPNAENAWKFYEDYNLLWRLRYKGEKQYLKMNEVKMFIFGKIQALGYGYKKELVQSNLAMLEKSKFELADGVEIPKAVQYIKKTVIGCPVDVMVYTKEGELVAELKNGILSDTTNEYGRFAVVYQPYSDEYAKVICQSTEEELDIKIVSVDGGLVDYKSAQAEKDNILSFDNVVVEEGDLIKVEDNGYQIMHKDNEEEEKKEFDTLEDTYIKPETMKLEETQIELQPGEEKILKVVVLPENATNKGISYYSEDENIAKVKNGVVTGGKEGRTVVWLRTLDNETVEKAINVKVGNPEGDVLPDDIPSDGIIPNGIWLAGIDETIYGESSIKHSFCVYDGTKMLKEKIDYTLTYKNNKNAYTYSDEDYATFEETLVKTGKKVKVGTFDPAKAPQVIIKMKGNYSGTKTVYFKIEPVDFNEGGVTAENLTVTYNGKKQTPVPKVTWNGEALKYGKDFYISEYDDAKKNQDAFKNPQTEPYNLTITGKGNFSGSLPITLTISESAKQIAMNKVTVKGIKNLKWTGESLSQNELKVTYKKDVLSEENDDYTISCGVNKDVGVGTVTFTGTGKDTDEDGYSYIGSKTVTFKIMGNTMNKAVITGIDKSYDYTGKNIRPAAALTYKISKSEEPIPMIENVHYTVKYEHNKEKGTATAVFTGLESGGFTGVKKKTFKITAADLKKFEGGDVTTGAVEISFKDTEHMNNDIYEAPCLKGGTKPEVIVTSGDITLKEGVDYTVSYGNYKKPAGSTEEKAPTVTIKGKGNFKGNKSITYSIVPKALTKENGITLVATDKVENGKRNGYQTKFKVYDADGKALGKNEYDVSSVTYTLVGTTNDDGTMTEENKVLDKDSIVYAGSEICITVKGKGIYAGGEVSGTYRIIEKGYDISKAVIQITPQEYTGKPVVITNQNQFKTKKVYLKIGTKKKELILGEDIEVVTGSYINHEEKGKAKVTFRGINDFGGTKTVTYQIGARSIEEFWKGIYRKIAEIWE